MKIEWNKYTDIKYVGIAYCEMHKLCPCRRKYWQLQYVKADLVALK